MTDLNDLASEIAKINQSKGWWDEDRDFLAMLMLVVSEASEAAEEYRNGTLIQDTYFNEGSLKPEGVPSELADIIIRVLDISAYHGIDIGVAVREKIEYNKTRSFRHGGKLA